MYSLVQVCKTCARRVLEEQVYPNENPPCIYCKVKALQDNVAELTRKRDDLMFAMELMDASYTEVIVVYNAAITELQSAQKELERLNARITTLELSQQIYKVDVNRLI